MKAESFIYYANDVLYCAVQRGLQFIFVKVSLTEMASEGIKYIMQQLVW
jgi:hypothetical protein